MHFAFDAFGGDGVFMAAQLGSGVFCFWRLLLLVDCA
jgi:hypothetical protein